MVLVSTERLPLDKANAMLTMVAPASNALLTAFRRALWSAFVAKSCELAAHVMKAIACAGGTEVAGCSALPEELLARFRGRNVAVEAAAVREFLARFRAGCEETEISDGSSLSTEVAGCTALSERLEAAADWALRFIAVPTT